MSDLEEDVLISTSIAKLRDIAAEDTGQCADVVASCHGQLKVAEPSDALAVLSTENERSETKAKNINTDSKNEDESVKEKENEKERELVITTQLLDTAKIKREEKDNPNTNKVDTKKSEQVKSKLKPKRKSRSVCCCCCRRKSREDLRELEDRNGIRIALYNDKLEEIETEKTIPEITTFQQDVVESGAPNRRQRCARKCIKCCKKFLTFLFSNVGLCSAVVAYSILGGFIFQRLEAPNEIQKRHFVVSLRKGYANDLWVLAQSRLILLEENFTSKADNILASYQRDVLEAKKNGWDGVDNNMEIEPQWSFAGSLLYSVTVITTIGYGHIAPKTVNGRLVTIFYALFGIPLTLLCLANMGGFLGNGFRLFYKHTCKLCTWLCCPPDESFTQKKATIPKSRSKSSQELSLLHKQETTSGNTLSVSVSNSPKQRKISRSRSRCSSPTATGSEINIVVEDYDHQQSKSKSKKTEHIRVPIFVSLLIISLYVFGGALMFSMWEPWSYLEGSYFCFITLSTIGFGDYVPGSISRVDSADSRQKLIICCVYLMFGLSVLAMCFDLMQEDVRAKFLWLGMKMGLVDRRR